MGMQISTTKMALSVFGFLKKLKNVICWALYIKDSVSYIVKKGPNLQITTNIIISGRDQTIPEVQKVH